jgi:hypothetical protein
MSVNDLLELNEMAAMLEATARKLARGSGRDELLRDIERFRAKLAELGLKAKAK